MDRPPYTYPAFPLASQYYADPSLSLLSVTSSFPLINVPLHPSSMDTQIQSNLGSHVAKRSRTDCSARLESSFVVAPRAMYPQSASIPFAPGLRPGSNDTPSQAIEHRPDGVDQTPDKTSDKSSKKRHPCWMCHKRFDRPSTLKKHLLVHTGEKAHECELCGRRFSVQSNLKRHGARCPKGPRKTQPTSVTGTSSVPSPPSSSSPSPILQCPISPSAPPTASSSSSSSSASIANPSVNPRAQAQTLPPKPKRTRRAPSPTFWIPPSLESYRITPTLPPSPIPLPPVVPYHDTEERDSFRKIDHPAPYTNAGWTGILPGPGLFENAEFNTKVGKVLCF